MPRRSTKNTPSLFDDGNGSRGRGGRPGGGPGATTIEPEDREFTREMETAYLEYSMSVIVSRALPDVRDGLKPVQRRILWGMQAGGLRATGPRSKCAKVVGDVMGAYHPHGDQAIYDALVRMAQPFSMYVPLVDGQGNFGSPGYPPAAYRYTECRMTQAAAQMLADIDEETVDFVPNYDGTTTEPSVLPAAFPNLLVNGASGIAVGMATSIPTHNPVEVIDAALLVLDTPGVTVKRVMRKLRGPDFPSGCDVVDPGDDGGIRAAFETGSGRVVTRAAVTTADAGRGSVRLSFRNLPPSVSVGQVAEQIVEHVKKGKLQSVANAVDASDKTGQELQVIVKKGHSAQATMAELFRLTKLEDSYSVNMRALVDGVPRVCNVLEILQAFCDHRISVVLRRSEFRRRKAQERAHLVRALMKALDAIDAVIAAIRRSRDRAAARLALIALLDIDDEQARAIVEMQLGRLTSLETRQLRKELADLEALIAGLTRVIDDGDVRRGVVRDELGALRAFYKDMKRRSRIVSAVADSDDTDDSDEEAEAVGEEPEADVGVRVMRGGWIEVTPPGQRPRPWRGGDAGMAPLADLALPASGRAGVITDDGRAWAIPLLDVPHGRRMALSDLADAPRSARIVAAFGIPAAGDDLSVLVAASDGRAKRLTAEDVTASRRDGLAIARLDDGATLVGACFVGERDHVLFVTSGGHAARVPASDIPVQGRTAAGVRAVKLVAGESVVLAASAPEDKVVVVGTAAGWVASIDLREVPSRGRGARGVAVGSAGGRRGPVVSAAVAERRERVYLVDDAHKLHETTADVASRTATGKQVVASIAALFV